MKIFISILTVLVVATFGYFFLVDAQIPVCGDFVVQAPNDAGDYERCDAGPSGSATCTPDCQAKILGWAWSDNIGWISLGDESCNPDYVPDLPVELQTWCTYPQGGSYNIIVDTDQAGTVSGFAWSNNVGWICFGTPSNPSYPECNWIAPDSNSANITLDFTTDPQNPPLQGWARILSLGNEGWISLNCEEGDGQGTDVCGNSNFNVAYSKGSFEGVGARTLNGFGWNNNDNNEGVGWIQFNPPIGEIQPWLETRYGDIYAREDILGNPAPGNAFNATYRILSGGLNVIPFTSSAEQGNQAWVSPTFGPIDFPTPDTRYSNVLGQLDVEDLLAKAETPYITSDLQIPSLLGGKIYRSAGNLVINGGISQFDNGTSFQDGSGTIIVEGNLTINTNIIYDPTGQTNRFRNLASVAWIVLGDLQIDGIVDELAGNFIVLGSGSSCTPDPTGCGQVLSCFSGTCENRLTVSGLMMAQVFEFNREFTDQQGVQFPGGSEIIIYDGRLLANTPPGLGDFAKALPIWRSGTFER